MPPLKVLAVDDSAVFRTTITRALETEPKIQVVGTAANGSIALQLIPQKKPDVVVLDVEMPGMNGLETLRQITQRWKDIKVIMFSAHTREGATATIEALSAGALDFVPKPSGGTLAENTRTIHDELVPMILALAPTTAPTIERPAPVVRPRPVIRRPIGPRFSKTPVVGIAVSTGGPNALAEFLPNIPANFPCPIVITQHMPPVFTEQLANRLNRLCNLPVCEAKSNQLVENGHIYVAPGDYHMEVVRRPTSPQPTIRLHQGPKENSCRPAADVMFRSLAESFGANVIGLVLTGMGQDGFEGSKILKACDAYLIAQDKNSCVVYGMPSFLVNSGLADDVLPLARIAARLCELVNVKK